MNIPEHIIDLGYSFTKKAGIKANRRQVKFMIADHVVFIESLGGAVLWPKTTTKVEEQKKIPEEPKEIPKETTSPESEK